MSHWCHSLIVNDRPPRNGQAVVRAMNKRDLEGLRKTLGDEPDGLRTHLAWLPKRESASNKHPTLTLGEAAVQMGWTAALPVLWEAGERFESGAHIGAMAMAVQKSQPAVVRKLLKLGVGLSYGRQGDHPLTYLALRSLHPDQNKAKQACVNACMDAGMDPWVRANQFGADTGTVLGKLLEQGHLVVANLMLARAVEMGATPPASLLADKERFWKCIGEGLTSYCNHWGDKALALNAPYILAIIDHATSLGLGLDPAGAKTLNQMVVWRLKDDGSSWHLARKYETWLQICNTLIEKFPQQPLLQAFADSFRSLAEVVPGEITSHWERRHLEQVEHPVLASGRPRPRI